MVRGLGVLADEGEILLVGLHVRTGQALGLDEGLERFLCKNLLRQFQPPDRHLPVARIGAVVRVDQRRLGGDRHWPAAPSRASVAADSRSSASRRHPASPRRPPRCPCRGRGGTAGRATARPDRHTRSRRSRRGWRRRGPCGEEVLQPGQRREVQLGVAVIGMRAGHLADAVEVEVILQVLADIRLVEHHVDAQVRADDPQARSPTAAATAATRWRRRTEAPPPPRSARAVGQGHAGRAPVLDVEPRTCAPYLIVRFARPRFGAR
jgi:hypothetical protein